MLNFTGKCNYIENFQRLGGAAGGGDAGEGYPRKGKACRVTNAAWGRRARVALYKKL